MSNITNISDLTIGQSVEIANSMQVWTITAIKAGWVEVSDDLGALRNIRAKQITCAYRTLENGSLALPEAADASADPTSPDHSDPISEELPEADESDDDDSGSGHSRMAGQLARYSKGYMKAKNASNTATKVAGDVLSMVSLALEVPQFVAWAASQLGDTTNRYAHLNPGQQRMNYGNRIRAAIRKGQLDLTEVVQSIGQLVGADLVDAYAAWIEAEQLAITTKLVAAELAAQGKEQLKTEKAAAKAEVKRALAETKAAKAA